MDTPRQPAEPGHDDLGDALRDDLGDDLGDARVRDLLAALGAQAVDRMPDPAMPDDVADRITASLRAETAARELAGRDLLTGLPAPGPMPDDVADRILASLQAEQRSRISQPAGSSGEASVVPLLRPRRALPRRWGTALVAAAAVAAVGVVGTVVVRTLSPDRAQGGIPARIHVQVSSERYQQDQLGAQARDLLAAAGATPTSNRDPASGPLTTTAGITSCLTGLGIHDATAVSVDLASFDGAPAAILVVTSDGTTRAYAVGRDCSDDDAHLLKGGVTVP